MNVSYANIRLPKVQATGLIPRLIHQTYRSGDLPEPIKENVAGLKSDNPDWDYCFYDDRDIERFIAETYSTDIYSAYKRINPIYGAARADFFRYLLMYYCGGVYLDIKSSFSGPISDFIREDDQFVIGQWNNGKGEPYEGWGFWPEVRHVPGGEFQQWFMIATPGHPFLRAAICAAVAKIEEYDAWRDGVGFVGVMRTTGPILYTRAIAPLLSSASYRVVRNTHGGPQYNTSGRRAHRAVLSNHYSTLSSPIVRREGLAAVWDRAYTIRTLVVRARSKFKSCLSD